VNQVCEYHLHAAIQRGRSGRAEIASATSSFFSTSQSGSWSSGAARGGSSGSKTGLLPRTGARPAPRGIDNGGGGATYVVNGRIVSTGKAGVNVLGNEYLSEKLGRGIATKKKRQLEAAETERALSALLQNDTGFAGGSTGGKYLAVLRKQNAALGADGKGKGKDKGEGTGAADLASSVETERERKRVFDADAIKRIGFDPTARRGQRNEEETKKRVRRCVLPYRS
jgi:minichromosome maintenance protein 10